MYPSSEVVEDTAPVLAQIYALAAVVVSPLWPEFEEKEQKRLIHEAATAMQDLSTRHPSARAEFVQRGVNLVSAFENSSTECAAQIVQVGLAMNQWLRAVVVGRYQPSVAALALATCRRTQADGEEREELGRRLSAEVDRDVAERLVTLGQLVADRAALLLQTDLPDAAMRQLRAASGLLATAAPSMWTQDDPEMVGVEGSKLDTCPQGLAKTL